MAWVATDNFDSYGNGNLSGNNGGSDWTSSWSTVGTGTWEPQVQSTVVIQGSKTIAMTPDAGSDRGAERSFTAITSGTMSFYARRTSKTGRFYISFLSSSTIAFTVDLNSSGYIVINNTTNIDSYEVDTDYEITVSFDCATDLLRVSVNGKNATQTFSFAAAVANIDKIRFVSADATSGVTNYFDIVQPDTLPTDSKYSLDLESSSSQYASISDASQTGLDLTGDFTVEAWIRPESFSDSQYIVGKYTTSGNQRSYLVYRNLGSGTLNLVTSGDGSTINDLGVSFNFINGIWYHIAITHSSGTATFYVNGRSIGTQTGYSNPYNSSADFTIGQANGGNYFDGLIKDVRVFSDVRSQSEIVADAFSETVSDANLQGEWNLNNNYNDNTANNNDLTASGSPVFSNTIPWKDTGDVSTNTNLTTNLISYWNLQETSGTRVDAHGSNDLTDNNTVLSGTGIIGNGADFEATNTEYLSITDAAQSGLDITGSFSVSFWAKVEAISADQTIFLKWTNPSQRGYGVTFSHSGGGISAVNIGISSDGSAVDTATVATSDISVGSFAHVVVTYTSGTGLCNVFINGKLIGQDTNTNTSIFNNTAPFIISANDSTAFDGVLDEFAIYNTVLDYGNVLDIYNAGLGITYTAPTPTPNNSGFFNLM